MLEGTLSQLTCVKTSYDFAMHEGRYPVFQASYGVRSSLLLQQPTTTTPAHWANHARHDLWERKVPDIKPRAAICSFPYQRFPLPARIHRQNYHPKTLFWNFILLISCYSKATGFKLKWSNLKVRLSHVTKIFDSLSHLISSETDIEKRRPYRNFNKTHIN